MGLVRGIVPWLSRLVLLAAVSIFTLIGLRNLLNPVAAAGAFHTVFGSPAGATSARVGSGAFPLAFAVILSAGLFSSRRRLASLTMVATIMGLATAARLLGLAVDGTSPESRRLLAPEVALMALSLFCAVFEWSTRGARAELEADSRVPVASRRVRLLRRIGLGLIVAPTVLLTGSALAKLAGVPAIVNPLEAVGFVGLVPLVGVLEFASAALLAFPLTRPLGLLMASAFLGGAIATHLQHGMSPVPPAALLGVLWIGAVLRRWAARTARGGRFESAVFASPAGVEVRH